MLSALLLAISCFGQEPCHELETTLRGFLDKHNPFKTGATKATIQTLEDELGPPDRVQARATGSAAVFLRDSCEGQVWLDSSGIVWQIALEKTTLVPVAGSFAVLGQLQSLEKKIAELKSDLEGLTAMRAYLLKQSLSAGAPAPIQLPLGTEVSPTDADQMFMASRFSEAVSAYTTILGSEPNNSRAQLKRAYSYHKIGHLREAVDDYSSVIARDPNTPIAYQNRALAYLGLGESEKALTDYDEFNRMLTAPESSRASGSSGGTSVGGGRAASSGDVSIQGYTRKDGTYVPPHTRSSPHRR